MQSVGEAQRTDLEDLVRLCQMVNTGFVDEDSRPIKKLLNIYQDDLMCSRAALFRLASAVLMRRSWGETR